MRVLSIALIVVAGFYGARIADNPLGGLVTMAILGAILLLARRVLRRRHQASPPNRS